MADIPAAVAAAYDAPDMLAERIAYMRRDFDLSTMERSRFWAEECRMLVDAMFAATQAPPAARDETLADIGGESVPRWVVEYADALTTHYAERGGGSWAIGGVQSREQAPPAAVPAGWVIERRDDGLAVIAPNCDPGGVTMTGPAGPLPNRLLYRLAEAMLDAAKKENTNG